MASSSSFTETETETNTGDDYLIEAEDTTDTDSTLGFDTQSETTSLNSLVLRFEEENGRRYHSYRSGQYAFPNDEDELDRMDFEHQLFNLMLDGKLHLAPLKAPQRILDLGTGSGVWALDIADEYPSANVIGTDLSPVQPNMVPPNLQFEVDDFEQDWLFSKDSFDFIHGRLLLASVGSYPKLFKKALRHLKPGGYLEIHDVDPGFYSDDNSIPPNCSAVQWGNLFYEACAKQGRAILPLKDYKPLMEQAGFVDVKAKIIKRPINMWPKDKELKRIGLYTLTNHLQGIHAFSIGLFTRVLGWSPSEVEILIAKCRSEWRDPSIHAYQEIIAVYGRKPSADGG